MKEMQVEHELNKDAYVGVDEMYQNAANHTEYPMNTEHEQAAIDASRAEYAEDNVEVADVEIEDDEENDGDVPGTGEAPEHDRDIPAVGESDVSEITTQPLL